MTFADFFCFCVIASAAIEKGSMPHYSEIILHNPVAIFCRNPREFHPTQACSI